MDVPYRRLLAEIEKIPLVDPHSHVNPLAPTARTLADLLGYHYYTELAHSAGMPKADLDADPRTQCRRIARWLPTISNTVQYSWLIHTARALFGFRGEHVNADNVDELFDLVEAKTSADGWTASVFANTNLEAIFLTNDFDDPLAGFDTAKYVPCLRTDDLAFKLDRAAVRERFARATGVEPTSLANLEAGLDKLFDHFTSRGARACAISLPPDFAPERPSDRDAQYRLEGFISGHCGDDRETYQRVVANWIVNALADRCKTHRLPFDLMIGVHRNVYEAGVYQGTDLYDQRASLYTFRKLFNEHPDCVFPVSVLAHPQNHELTSYTWIFPNVVANGHWWYSNIPACIEPDLRARLEAAPQSKLIGYYSDAYKLEFVLPKFAMYRACLARVLVRDFVLARGWSEARALDLARTVLRENALRIFPGRK